MSVKQSAVSVSARYLQQLPSFCPGVEGTVRPGLNPPLRAATTVCSVLVKWRGEGVRKRPVDLDSSQGKECFFFFFFFTLAKVTHCSL